MGSSSVSHVHFTRIRPGSVADTIASHGMHFARRAQAIHCSRLIAFRLQALQKSPREFRVACQPPIDLGKKNFILLLRDVLYFGTEIRTTLRILSRILSYFCRIAFQQEESTCKCVMSVVNVSPSYRIISRSRLHVCVSDTKSGHETNATVSRDAWIFSTLRRATIQDFADNPFVASRCERDIKSIIAEINQFYLYF